MDTHDPRLTAYALDELSPVEAALLERALADDPEARDAVAEIRETAALLERGLLAEPMLALTVAQRQEILQRAAGAGAAKPVEAATTTASLAAPPQPDDPLELAHRFWWPRWAVAASLLCVFGLGLALREPRVPSAAGDVGVAAAEPRTVPPVADEPQMTLPVVEAELTARALLLNGSNLHEPNPTMLPPGIDQADWAPVEPSGTAGGPGAPTNGTSGLNADPPGITTSLGAGGVVTIRLPELRAPEAFPVKDAIHTIAWVSGKNVVLPSQTAPLAASSTSPVTPRAKAITISGETPIDNVTRDAIFGDMERLGTLEKASKLATDFRYTAAGLIGDPSLRDHAESKGSLPDLLRGSMNGDGASVPPPSYGGGRAGGGHGSVGFVRGEGQPLPGTLEPSLAPPAAVLGQGAVTGRGGDAGSADIEYDLRGNGSAFFLDIARSEGTGPDVLAGSFSSDAYIGPLPPAATIGTEVELEDFLDADVAMGKNLRGLDLFDGRNSSAENLPEITLDFDVEPIDNVRGFIQLDDARRERQQAVGGFFFKDANQDVRGRTENIFDRPLGNNLSQTGGLALQWALIDDAEYNFLIQTATDPAGGRNQGFPFVGQDGAPQKRGGDNHLDLGLGKANDGHAAARTFSIANFLGDGDSKEVADPLAHVFNVPGLADLEAGIVHGSRAPARRHVFERYPGHEGYDIAYEKPWTTVRDEPLSTFSMDVDTASYSNCRRMLAEGHLPPKGAVRIEEFVNSFSYSYPKPAGDAPLAIDIAVTACPWAPDHRLARIGIKAREVQRDQRPAVSLTFLVDVSGSMEPMNKLPLLKESLRLLLGELTPADRVALVTFAGGSQVVLPSTACSEKDAILAAIDGLAASGSTNGASGIELAYQTAAAAFSLESFPKDGAHRVILATDGDFNAGMTDRNDLRQLIEDRARTGVFLTVLGFGMGNVQDGTMEDLSNRGNGNYAYIDSREEAEKALVYELEGTLLTVAKDCKVQVELNPALVSGYRLIGYNNRQLAAADFNNDAKDAGDVGAGQTVTALYELVPVPTAPAPGVDALKYQQSAALSAAALSGELFTVKVRYKDPAGAESKLLSCVATDSGKRYAEADTDTRFAAAVAAFAMLLDGSPHAGHSTYAQILELAGAALGDDEFGLRAELLDLVKRARDLSR